MKKLICAGLLSLGMLSAMCQSNPYVPDTNHQNKPAVPFRLPSVPLQPFAQPLLKNSMPGLISQAKPSVTWVLPETGSAGKITGAKVDNMAIVQPAMDAVEKMPNASGLVTTGDWVVPTKKRP